MNVAQIVINALVEKEIHNEFNLIPQDEPFWEACFNFSVDHRVDALVFEYYKNLWPISFRKSIIFKNWLKRYLKIILDLEMLGKKAEILYKSMSEENYEHVILKGMVLKEYYRNPYLRYMCDIDLFMPLARTQTKKLDEYLHLLGYQRDLDLKHDSHFIYESEIQLSLEVHWILLDEERFYKPQWFNEQCWQRKVLMSDENANCYRLCHEDHLIFLFCHAVKHLKGTGLGLKQLLDIRLLLGQVSEEVVDSVIIALKRLKVYRISIYLLELVNRHFNYHYAHDYPIDESMLEELFNNICRAGAYGNNEDYFYEAIQFRKARNLGLKVATQSKIQIVFPPLNKMRRTYRYLHHFPILLPIAWVQRLKYQLRTHKKEFRLLYNKNVDYNYINNRLSLIDYLENDI